MKESMKLVLRAIFSVGLLAIIFLVIDYKKVIELLTKFNFFLLPVVLGLAITNIVLYTTNYWFLIGKKISLFETTIDYFVVWSASLFLPGKFGELGIIPILKKKAGVRYTIGTVSTTVPKIILLGLWVCFFIIGFVFAGGRIENRENIALIGTIIAFAACIIFLLRKRLQAALLKIRFIGKVLSRIELAKNIFTLKNSVLSLFIGLARFGCFILMVETAFMGFNYQPNLPFLLMAITVSETSSFLPISLSGLGVREATFSGIMTITGTPIEVCIGVLLLLLTINYSIAVISMVAWNLPKFNAQSRASK
jgi:uncharacterized membrane protein YbhN (UPF0104 family)